MIPTTVTVCTDCGGPLPKGGGLGPSSLPSRDDGDGSSSSTTNNDDSETALFAAANLADELKAVQAREELYGYRGDLAMAKSGLNGKSYR